MRSLLIKRNTRTRHCSPQSFVFFTYFDYSYMLFHNIMALKLCILGLSAWIWQIHAQRLRVFNTCGSTTVFLNTVTTRGHINNNINIPTGETADMEISTDWEGAINIG